MYFEKISGSNDKTQKLSFDLLANDNYITSF